MNTFRTELSPRASTCPVSLRQKILTLGSCFSDSIGEKLQAGKFSVSVNPFGVTYNPLSIHKHLLRAIYNEPPAGHTFLTQGDIHLSYDFHSKFSSLSLKDLQATLLDTIGQCHHFLKETRHVIITYGTAWVFERSDTGEVVANCHKVPSGQFKKFLLTQKRIIESFDEVHRAAMAFNPAIRFILTLSPVRHVKDTLELNSVSKAVLRLTCHTLTELYPNVEYFPAYELLMDDLRDYRFYDSDLIHPSPEAITYIWDKFQACHLDHPTRMILEKWNQVARSLSHKPFHPESAAHQKFIRDTLLVLEELRPKINVEEEIDLLKKQLRKN